eukprot:XP_001710221.1 Hypothetical protein GL50803_103715 [Giardia lamblia ATCC 50803]
MVVGHKIKYACLLQNTKCNNGTLCKPCDHHLQCIAIYHTGRVCRKVLIKVRSVLGSHSMKHGQKGKLTTRGIELG